MATVALVLAALLVIATVVLIVFAVRRRPGPIAFETGPAGGRSSLDRLEVGAEVAYDEREWVVIGRQRFPAQGSFAEWSAWHLDLKGQPGWLATVEGDDDHVIFAVGAERPETIDPTLDPVIWRDAPWTRVAESAPGPQPVEVQGQRRRNKQAPEDLTADDAERVTYTREDLPRRRLILERRVTDDRWAAWIGDRIPASMIDVTRWSADDAGGGPSAPNPAGGPQPS